jgi:hypothetical protein
LDQYDASGWVSARRITRGMKNICTRFADMKCEIFWQIIGRDVDDFKCREANHYSIQFNQIKSNQIKSNQIESNEKFTTIVLSHTIGFGKYLISAWILLEWCSSSQCFMKFPIKFTVEPTIEWQRRTNSACLSCVIRNPLGTRAYQYHARMLRSENRKRRPSISADGSNIAQSWITVWIAMTWWGRQFARRAATGRSGQWHATVYHSGIRTGHRFVKTLTKPVLLRQSR